MSYMPPHGVRLEHDALWRAENPEWDSGTEVILRSDLLYFREFPYTFEEEQRALIATGLFREGPLGFLRPNYTAIAMAMFKVEPMPIIPLIFDKDW
jgi:hypothetical protein